MKAAPLYQKSPSCSRVAIAVIIMCQLFKSWWWRCNLLRQKGSRKGWKPYLGRSLKVGRAAGRVKAAVIATKCYTNYDRHSQWLSCQLFYKQKIISLLPPLLTARPSCFPREGSATQWVVVRGGKSIVYFRYPRRSSQAYSLGKSGPKQSIPMMRTKKKKQCKVTLLQ